VKLKVVENFTISVRIYYENRTGFHYICSLMRKEKQITERELLTLLRRDCENFSNKGIQFTIVKQVEVNQLGERLELS
jgi:predicted hydrolase (HD superfamily)